MQDSGSEEEIKPFNPFKQGRIYKKKEIVFDEDKRKEYLTGFRKRKLQRRQEAQRIQREKDKQQKKEEKQKKKEVLMAYQQQHRDVKNALQGIEENEDEEEEEDEKGTTATFILDNVDGNTAVYETNDSTITTTVSELELPEEYKQVDPHKVKMKSIKRKVEHVSKTQKNKKRHFDAKPNKKKNFDMKPNKKKRKK